MKTKSLSAPGHALRLGKLAALTIVLVGLTAVSSTSFAQCLPPPSGLVGWWPGDENANDIIGGNNGTLVNGTGFAPGKVGSAFKFNGTNNYVQIPDSAALKPANITVEAWVKFDSLFPPGANVGLEYIVFKKNSRAGNFEGYTLYKSYSGTNHLFVFLVSSAAGVPKPSASITQVITGLFYHVVGTYDGSVMRLYVNGVLESTNVANFPLDYGTRPVFIGTSGESSYDGKLSGLVDEVSIYNRALSAGEIAAIYAAGSSGKCTAMPEILTQPQNQLGYYGGTATFTVSARGDAPLTYQWRNGNNPIGSATTNTMLTLTNLQSTNAGNYTVIVSNSFGSVTSSPPANLSVNLAGVSIALYPGVTIDGVIGLTYGIQSTTNLANTNSWIGRTNLTLSVTPLIWSDYQPAPSQTFYRVLPGPIPIP